MPGVNVTTSVRTGPTNPAGPPEGQVILVGITERGPVDGPRRVTSIAQFEQTFGGLTAYSGNLYDSVRVFFEEGGYTALVGRVVGPAAAAGFLTLKDRDADEPADTLKITAFGPGAWSANLTVEVAAGTQADTFKLIVGYNGATVETYDNLASPADAVTALSGSAWVRGQDMASETAAPDNQPAVAAAAPLSAGTDDRAAITAEHVAAALNLIGVDYGPGAVAAPGWPATTVGDTLVAHAKSHNRIALLAGSATDTVATIKSTAAGLATDGEWAALLFPWLTFPDGSGTRQVSPESFAAAARARANSAVGFWQVPAGEQSAAQFVTGTVTPVDQAINNDLAAARVSGVVTVGGRIKLYGWFGLSGDAAFTLLNSRDVLNVLTARAEGVLEPYVWATVDGRGLLLSEVEAALRGMLQPIADRGGFFPRSNEVGDELDPGYSVTVNELNTTDTLADNEIHVTLAVRLSPSAKEIYVNIVKAAVTASV